MSEIYRPKRLPVSERITLRGLRHHVTRWGEPGNAGPLWVMLHGWMDTGGSFQFLVDELGGDSAVIAPDWRGFGDTEWGRESYYFPDYLADLDALLDHYAGDRPVRLLGHSLGGNVACLYGGARSGRLSHLISLEGFGLRPGDAGDAPGRYREWLDEQREAPRFRPYADFDELAAMLCKRNPRLAPDKAAFIAHQWARTGENGGVELRGDPAHKRVNPVLYRLSEAKACWREVTAPTLWLAGEHTAVRHLFGDDEDFRDRRACFRDMTYRELPEAGHMMHHEIPGAVAREIEEFMRRAGTDGNAG